MKDLILDLKRQGKTVLMCSHLLADVQDVCDRIAMLHQGELKELGRVDALLKVRDVTEIRATGLSEECKAELQRGRRAARRQVVQRIDNPTTTLEELFLEIVQDAEARPGRRRVGGVVTPWIPHSIFDRLSADCDRGDHGRRHARRRAARLLRLLRSPTAALGRRSHLLGARLGSAIWCSFRRGARWPSLGWRSKNRFASRRSPGSIIFLLVLAFALWFLDAESIDPSALYISFVLNAVNYLILLMAVLTTRVQPAERHQEQDDLHDRHQAGAAVAKSCSGASSASRRSAPFRWW